MGSININLLRKSGYLQEIEIIIKIKNKSIFSLFYSVNITQVSTMGSTIAHTTPAKITQKGRYVLIMAHQLHYIPLYLTYFD